MTWILTFLFVLPAALAGEAPRCDGEGGLKSRVLSQLAELRQSAISEQCKHNHSAPANKAKVDSKWGACEATLYSINQDLDSLSTELDGVCTKLGSADTACGAEHNKDCDKTAAEILRSASQDLKDIEKKITSDADKLAKLQNRNQEVVALYQKNLEEIRSAVEEERAAAGTHLKGDDLTILSQPRADTGADSGLEGQPDLRAALAAHQITHPGQISGLIAQLGGDKPVTDPLIQEQRDAASRAGAAAVQFRKAGGDLGVVSSALDTRATTLLEQSQRNNTLDPPDSPPNKFDGSGASKAPAGGIAKNAADATAALGALSKVASALGGGKNKGSSSSSKRDRASKDKADPARKSRDVPEVSPTAEKSASTSKKESAASADSPRGEKTYSGGAPLSSLSLDHSRSPASKSGASPGTAIRASEGSASSGADAERLGSPEKKHAGAAAAGENSPMADAAGSLLGASSSANFGQPLPAASSLPEPLPAPPKFGFTGAATGVPDEFSGVVPSELAEIANTDEELSLFDRVRARHILCLKRGAVRRIPASESLELLFRPVNESARR